jgi:hypothetical protein
MLYICIFSNKFDLIQAIRASHIMLYKTSSDMVDNNLNNDVIIKVVFSVNLS